MSIAMRLGPIGGIALALLLANCSDDGIVPQESTSAGSGPGTTGENTAPPEGSGEGTTSADSQNGTGGSTSSPGETDGPTTGFGTSTGPAVETEGSEGTTGTDSGSTGTTDGESSSGGESSSSDGGPMCAGNGMSCAGGEACCPGLMCCGGVPVPPGAEFCGMMCPISDYNRKRDFEAIDPEVVLDKVAALPITEWSYRFEDPSIRHIGPMAQDFMASFEVGASDESIFVVDADGVSLAAIQALYARLQAAEQENAQLRRSVDDLEQRLRRLEAK